MIPRGGNEGSEDTDNEKEPTPAHKPVEKIKELFN